MKHANYWSGNSLWIPKEVDVAIIGGGIAGLALAYDLTVNSALSVGLFEQNPIGHGASGRSFGRVGIPNSDLAIQIKSWHGSGKLRDYRKLVKSNGQLLKRIIKQERIDCELSECGSIALANSSKLLDGLVFGDEHLLLKQEIANLIPTSRFDVGLYTASDFTVNPYKLLVGLEKVCNVLGRRIFPGSLVDKITADNKLYIHDKGITKAAIVVYCDGAKSKLLNSQLYLWRKHLLVTSLVPESIIRLFTNACLMNHDKEVRTHNGKFLISGETEPAKNLNDEINSEQMLTWFSSVFPCIPKNLSASMVWSYVNASGKDGLPLVGKISDTQYASIGCGFNLSFEAATLIRQLILGQTSQDAKHIFYPQRKMNV